LWAFIGLTITQLTISVCGLIWVFVSMANPTVNNSSVEIFGGLFVMGIFFSMPASNLWLYLLSARVGVGLIHKSIAILLISSPFLILMGLSSLLYSYPSGDITIGVYLVAGMYTVMVFWAFLIKVSIQNYF